MRKLGVACAIILIACSLAWSYYSHEVQPRIRFMHLTTYVTEMGLAQREYAMLSDGDFPPGAQGNPCVAFEVLLCRDLLSQETFSFKALRGADSAECAWCYIDGLRSTDNPGVALCWAKFPAQDFIGVVCIRGNIFVSKDKWQNFCDQQNALLGNIRRPTHGRPDATRFGGWMQ